MAGVHPAPGEPPHPFLQAREEQTVLRQLARLSVEPRQIELMIATHLDEDHAGFIDAFPKTEIVIQQGHRAAIRDLGLPRFDAVRPNWDPADLRFREVQGDVEVTEGVSVIESGGHVPGHQSVLVELPQTGPVLLAIDAIPHHEMIDPETRVIMPIDLDAMRTRESTRKLMEPAAQAPALRSRLTHARRRTIESGWLLNPE
ncbi:MAG TPA: MBL fold metallo-hydrolase [Chthoniobacterales bacterium]